MTLPPQLQAIADELLACAPPLTPAQARQVRAFAASAEQPAKAA